jgi:excisionase family DNA binding protein
VTISNRPGLNTNGLLAVDFKEGSRLTSLSPFTLRKYVRDGKLRATRCGRRWVIPVEELNRLVHEGV